MPILILLGLAAFLYFKGEDTLNTVVQNLDAWNKYDEKFKYYASKNGLPSDGWLWLKAIALNESSLGQNPLVKTGLWSSDGLSRGIMQLTVATANDYQHWVSNVATLKRDNPKKYEEIASLLDNDDLSINLSAQHFARLYRKFGRTLEHAVKAYNQGEGNMAKEIALRASRGIAANGVEIAEYPAAANYWRRFEKNLAKAKEG